jgi:hypothetical protein
MEAAGIEPAHSSRTALPTNSQRGFDPFESLSDLLELFRSRGGGIGGRLLAA